VRPPLYHPPPPPPPSPAVEGFSTRRTGARRHHPSGLPRRHRRWHWRRLPSARLVRTPPLTVAPAGCCGGPPPTGLTRACTARRGARGCTGFGTRVFPQGARPPHRWLRWRQQVRLSAKLRPQWQVKPRERQHHGRPLEARRPVKDGRGRRRDLTCLRHSRDRYRA